MPLENTAGLYAAFKAKDARFDGRVFVGISSTRIYCRPVCRARQPRRENCTFFRTAAEAERSGYRPCLLCRPEIAPGRSTTDAARTLAHQAARLLEENCGNGLSLEELAGKLNCSARHLRRVFAAEYNVSPVEYLQTCRLLLAKNLLTDTEMSIVDVAMAAGFGSLRRFNDVFKEHYRMPPTQLRKQRKQDAVAKDSLVNDGITLMLGYRPPYLWDELIQFLAGRAISGVELVENGEYARTARLLTPRGEYAIGWLKVAHRPKKNAVAVTVSDSLLPALPQVLARVRRLFDLHCDPETVFEALGSMNEIRPELHVLGTRVPGCFDAFEMATRAVLGQQITVKAAGTLAVRITEQLGTPIETGIPGLTQLFPTAEEITALHGPIEDQLGPLGVIATRSRTIRALAEALTTGELHLGPQSNPEQEIERLRAIPGIGDWTAQYLAMRSMEWPDAFLETDVGVRKALHPRSPKELRELAEAWRPWRSYATVSLWNTL